MPAPRAPRHAPAAAALLFACALAGLALPAPIARAQNALGDGTALDAGLGASRVNTRVKDLAAQIRFNNQIITGQAAGGRSFRGSVGYRAADEFRGNLGSETLFNFRRDSAFSQANATGLRTSDALRYQLALSTGGSAGATLPPSVGRYLTQAQGAVSTAAAAASLRSTALLSTQSSRLPSILGYSALPDPQGQIRRAAITASPLTGIALTPLSTPAGEGLNPLAIPRALSGLERPAAGVQSIADPEFGEGSARERALARETFGQVSTRIAADSRSYRQIVQSLERAAAGPDGRASTNPTSRGTPDERNTGAGAPGPDAPDAPAPVLKNALERELERVRRQLRPDLNPQPARETPPPGSLAPAPPGATPGAAPGTPGLTTPPGTTIPGLAPLPTLPGVLPTPANAPAAPGADADEPLADPTIPLPELLRRAQSRLDRFVDPQAVGDAAFDRGMRDGEDALARQRFFDAEGAFSIALIHRPGDPIATVARTHAQLGGGLLLSAAGNLRGVLTAHPELIATRYAPALLFPRQRADELAETLRADVAKDAPRPDRAGAAPGTTAAPQPSALGPDAGLLLAYLGRQFDEPAWMREGLDALQRRTSADDQPAAALTTLLREVWLTPEPAPAAPAAPAPAPAAP